MPEIEILKMGDNPKEEASPEEVWEIWKIATHEQHFIDVKINRKTRENMELLGRERLKIHDPKKPIFLIKVDGWSAGCFQISITNLEYDKSIIVDNIYLRPQFRKSDIIEKAVIPSIEHFVPDAEKITMRSSIFFDFHKKRVLKKKGFSPDFSEYRWELPDLMPHSKFRKPTPPEQRRKKGAWRLRI